MSLPILASSGDEPVSTVDHEWTDVMSVGFSTPINFMTLYNEGDNPGFWRIVDSMDKATEPVRLAAGEGEPGARVSVTNIPCPGFKGGKLQVKRGLVTGHLTNIFAWGM